MFVAGFNKKPQPNEVVFQPKDLPSIVGRISDSARVAEQSVDKAGLVSFGPYISLGKGKYEVLIKYSSVGSVDQQVGLFDVLDSVSATEISKASLVGTDGAVQEVRIRFKSREWTPRQFEFRSHWNGLFDLKVYQIILREI